MNELTAGVLVAITSIARGPAANDPAHLSSVARDISSAAASAPMSPFEGDSKNLGLALALVAIAKHESEFDPKVDRCERRGDVGRSITLFQLMRGPNWGGYSDEKLCKDRALAARLATVLFTRPAAKLPHATPQMLANAYASGSPGKTTRAAREICTLWERLAKQAGLAKATCGARTSLDGSPAPKAQPARRP
jgi:hypothetical protein